MSPRQPSWVDPMKAALTTTYFSDPEWIYEPKVDGIRCLAFKSGKTVRLLSRNKLSLNERYPDVAASLAGQEGDFILDGELAAAAAGRTSFSLLQQARRQSVSVGYFIFDLVHHNGTDLRKRPLIERKQALEQALEWKAPLYLVDHIETEGEAFYQAACQEGLEGVIAKRADSPYVGARSRDWQKFKCSNEQEFVVIGFTDPQGSRVGFGALLVGVYDEKGELRYAGKVGTGFDTKMLLDLRQKLDRLETDKAPFDAKGIRQLGRHWVEPKLVAQVAFAEWTGDGRLRHPRFVGLRTDKPPREVVREQR